MKSQPGRRCTICTHGDLVDIQKAIAESVPLSEICFQYPGLQKSSLSRHAARHMGRNPTRKTTVRGSGYTAPKRLPTKSRSESDEDGELDAKSIIAEAKRILRRSEEIVSRAEDNDDYRLAVAAIDRCQKAVDSLAKIAGLIGPDVIIDQRQQVNIYAAWSTEALGALESFHAALESGKSVQEACRAVQPQDSEIPVAPNMPALRREGVNAT